MDPRKNMIKIVLQTINNKLIAEEDYDDLKHILTQFTYKDFIEGNHILFLEHYEALTFFIKALLRYDSTITHTHRVSFQDLYQLFLGSITHNVLYRLAKEFLLHTKPRIVINDKSESLLLDSVITFENTPTLVMFENVVRFINFHLVSITNSKEVQHTSYNISGNTLELYTFYEPSRGEVQACTFNGKEISPFSGSGCKEGGDPSSIIISFFELLLACIQKLTHPSAIIGKEYYGLFGFLFQHFFYLISAHFLHIPNDLYMSYFTKINSLVGKTWLQLRCDDTKSPYTCGRAYVPQICKDNTTTNTLFNTVSETDMNMDGVYEDGDKQIHTPWECGTRRRSKRGRSRKGKSKRGRRRDEKSKK